MQEALHIRPTVQPGGKVGFVSPDLEPGQIVDVVVLPAPAPSTRSAWQIISEGPGQHLSKSAKEVDDYVVVERASWDC